MSNLSLSTLSTNMCSVPGCTSRQNLFGFPSDDCVGMHWLLEIRNPVFDNLPYKHIKRKRYSVCALHFKSHEIRKFGLRSLLAKGSVPSLNLPKKPPSYNANNYLNNDDAFTLANPNPMPFILPEPTQQQNNDVDKEISSETLEMQVENDPLFIPPDGSGQILANKNKDVANQDEYVILNIEPAPSEEPDPSIPKVKKMCRTCLLESDEDNMLSVFSKIDSTGQLIYKMIMSFTSLQISKFDEMSKLVCMKCVNDIKVAYSFREMCEKNHKSLLNTIPPNPIVDFRTEREYKNKDNNKKQYIVENPDVDYILLGDNVTEEDVTDIISDLIYRKENNLALTNNEYNLGKTKQKLHRQLTLPKGLYNCNKCYKPFAFAKSLYEHMKTHKTSIEPRIELSKYLKKRWKRFKESNTEVDNYISIKSEPEAITNDEEAPVIDGNNHNKETILTAKSLYEQTKKHKTSIEPLELSNYLRKRWKRFRESNTEVDHYISMTSEPEAITNDEEALVIDGNNHNKEKILTDDEIKLEIELPCDSCNLTFNDQCELNAHIQSHTSKNPPN